MSEKTKFIFITGGVVSSLGKGLASASLASVLQSRGFKVRMRKLDPYLNVDPGTMSPYQHGEVYVTDDGAETDLDLGHYERFSGVSCHKTDSITTGKIYQRVIDKERRGDYLGATIQVVPHVTNEIKDFILSDITDEDFVLCEIGGTVGDIEGQPYLEAIRQIAEASQTPGGMDAVNLKVAERYVDAFSNVAKETNTVLLPANMGDMGSMIASAMTIMRKTDPKMQAQTMAKKTVKAIEEQVRGS